MKSFGQIAHDKGVEVGGWARRWETMSEMQRREWELIAAAVIDANRFKVKEERKIVAWYDPTNQHVSINKDDPLFTPLGQVWPLYMETK